MTRAVTALVRSWLLLDFFAESRRSGQPSSTLTTTIFGQSFLAFGLAALLVPDRRDGSTMVAYCAANLSLSSLLIGLGALGDPAVIERTRADATLLRTAPLPARTIVLAKALHGSFAVLLLAIGMALPPAILGYWVAAGSAGAVVRYLVVACVLAGLAVGFVALVQRLAERWLGPERGLSLAATTKALLGGLGFAGFALGVPLLSKTAAELPGGPLSAQLWPPYWGARWIAEPAGAWQFGLLLLLAALVIFALAALLEQPARSIRSRPAATPLRVLDRWFLRQGAVLGLAAFTSTLLWRGARFRAKVLPIFGVPAALVLLALGHAEPPGSRILLAMALQLPAAYLPILIAFLPQADEEGAAVIFNTSPNAQLVPLARAAARRSLVTHVLLPAHALALVLMLGLGIGVLFSVSMFCFSMAVAILVTGLTLRALDAVPFSEPGEAMALDAGQMIALGVGLGAVGGAFAIVADHPLAAGLAFVGLGAAVASLREAPR